MNYTADEVRALIAWWSELRNSPKLWLLVRYADLERAINLLPPHEYQAVLLYGQLGLPSREVASLLSVGSNKTIANRFERGVVLITDILNGAESY